MSDNLQSVFLIFIIQRLVHNNAMVLLLSVMQIGIVDGTPFLLLYRPLYIAQEQD